MNIWENYLWNVRSRDAKVNVNKNIMKKKKKKKEFSLSFFLFSLRFCILYRLHLLTLLPATRRMLNVKRGWKHRIGKQKKQQKYTKLLLVFTEVVCRLLFVVVANWKNIFICSCICECISYVYIFFFLAAEKWKLKSALLKQFSSQKRFGSQR